MVSEAELYPRVERWLRQRFHCFVTGTDRGMTHGRIDVLGIRDTGGDLSGSAELISVEVKGGRQPFARAAGQAYGYSVYAERCYLADIRGGRSPFSDQEIAIASRLGIGLLSIASGGRIQEVLSSPIHEPIEAMRLQAIEKLGYSECSICGSIFQRGDATNWAKFVQRAGTPTAMTNALRDGKGLVYWISEVGGRQARLRPRKLIYHRRYVCPDCVLNLYGPRPD